MGQWQDFPLPDGSYSDSTRPWSQQDIVNYLPTFAEASGTRSRVKYATAPGLKVFADVGDGPHRGARDVEGKLFVVSGNKLYQVAVDGSASQLGTIPGTGRVSITHNQIDGGNQVVIGVRDNSYVWNTVTSTLTATGVGLLSVDFLNQYVLGVDPARRFWRWSGLADALTYSTIDNESAESSPDRIVGGIVSQGEWLVFGERTIEAWRNDPNQDATFVRGAVIERGCRNANTLCRLDNSVFFVDNNGIPCRLVGYAPTPIAPKAIIDEISSCDPTKLFAFTWEDKGYVVYYVTAQDGRTWGYDVTSQKWHRRESFGLDRWRINTLFKWDGSWYGGDYQNGKLYRLVWGYTYEGCEIMPRRIRTGVLHNNGNRVFVHGLRLNVATGGVPSVGCDPVFGAPTITGDLPSNAVGATGTYQYTVSGGTPPRAVSIISGSLPPGATMDANGLVTYNYTTPGSYSWTVQVVDSLGGTDSVADTAIIDEFCIDIRNPELDAVHYLLVANTDTNVTYAESDYDYSAWATGKAIFDSYAPNAVTLIPQLKKIWCRHSIVLSSTTGLSLEYMVDDLIGIWNNGVNLLDGFSPGGGLHTYNFNPSDLVVGCNHFVITGTDTGAGRAYLKWRFIQ